MKRAEICCVVFIESRRILCCLRCWPSSGLSSVEFWFLSRHLCVHAANNTTNISQESQVKSQFNNSEHDLRGVVKNLSRLVHKNMIFFLFLVSLRILQCNFKDFPSSPSFSHSSLCQTLFAALLCVVFVVVYKKLILVFMRQDDDTGGERKKQHKKRERVETMSIFSVTLNNWPCVLTFFSV